MREDSQHDMESKSKAREMIANDVLRNGKEFGEFKTNQSIDLLEDFLNGDGDFLNNAEDLDALKSFEGHGDFLDNVEDFDSLKSHKGSNLLDEFLKQDFDDLDLEDNPSDLLDSILYDVNDSEQIRKMTLKSTSGDDERRPDLMTRRSTWSLDLKNEVSKSRALYFSLPTDSKNGKENVQSLSKKRSMLNSDSLDMISDKLQQELTDVDIDDQYQGETWSPEERKSLPLTIQLPLPSTKSSVQDQLSLQSPRSVKNTIFQDMPASPLIATRRFFVSALGLNHKHQDIAVRIAEICFQTRSHNGGIISVSKVHEAINQTSPVKFADIVLAIKELKTVGYDFRIMKAGYCDLIISV